eukprot:56205-Pyramimonas_sp.AAC.1
MLTLLHWNCTSADELGLRDTSEEFQRIAGTGGRASQELAATRSRCKLHAATNSKYVPSRHPN